MYLRHYNAKLNQEHKECINRHFICELHQFEETKMVCEKKKNLVSWFAFLLTGDKKDKSTKTIFSGYWTSLYFLQFASKISDAPDFVTVCLLGIKVKQLSNDDKFKCLSNICLLLLKKLKFLDFYLSCILITQQVNKKHVKISRLFHWLSSSSVKKGSTSLRALYKASFPLAPADLIGPINNFLIFSCEVLSTKMLL